MDDELLPLHNSSFLFVGELSMLAMKMAWLGANLAGDIAGLLVMCALDGDCNTDRAAGLPETLEVPSKVPLSPAIIQR